MKRISPPPAHGTRNTYLYHRCRCEACVLANREYQRWYMTRPERTSRRRLVTLLNRVLKQELTT